jgi:hypothetical protein
MVLNGKETFAPDKNRLMESTLKRTLQPKYFEVRLI